MNSYRSWNCYYQISVSDIQFYRGLGLGCQVSWWKWYCCGSCAYRNAPHRNRCGISILSYRPLREKHENTNFANSLRKSTIKARFGPLLLHRDKTDIDEFRDLKLESWLKTVIDIVVIFINCEGEGISRWVVPEVFSIDALDIEPHTIKNLCQFHEETTTVSEDTLNRKTDTSISFLSAPICWYSTFEFNFGNIFTLDSVDGHDSLSDDSNNSYVLRSRTTALSNAIWDISFFSDDDGCWFFFFDWWGFFLFFLLFFFFFLLDFAHSKMMCNNIIMNCLEDASWFSWKISELYEDVFFLFGIKVLPVNISENRKLLVKTISIVSF